MSKSVQTHYALAMIAVFGLLTLCPAPTSATVFKSGEDINITNIHRIDDDLVTSSKSLTVGGIITGDLISFTENATVLGHIHGSETIAGYMLNHSGRVDGSLRMFGYNCTVEGQVGGSALIAANTITIGQIAVVDKTAHLWGDKITIEGSIGEDLIIGNSRRVRITGHIKGDVDITADHITIAPPAVIDGNLTYTSENEADIKLKEGVTVTGAITHNLPDVPNDNADIPFSSFVIGIAQLLAAFLFGIIMLALFRRYAEETVTQLRTRLAASLAAGFISLLVVTASAVALVFALILSGVGAIIVQSDQAIMGALLLALSLVAIPITSFISVSGGVVFYSGKIVVGLLLGVMITRRGQHASSSLTRGQLLLGLIILAVAFAVPIIGTVVYIVVGLIGAGGIILAIRQNHGDISIHSSAPTTMPNDEQQPPLPEPPPPVT